MGIVTVSIEDRLMAEFRREAASTYGKGKGYLKKAFDEAITLWLKLKGETPESNALRILKKGMRIGYKPISRSEYYSERLSRYPK